MKEQIKTPEKELSDKETDNLSDAEFKTLVIKMLTELIELGHKMRKEMKATQSEIKENIQGTNSEGKETGTQINDLKQKEETRNQKNEDRLGNLWDNFKCTNIRIIRVPEGEEEEQEMENLFEKIMKGNRLPGSLGSSRVPKKLGPTRNTPRHIIIKLSKIKEERILKAARGESYLQRSAYRMSKYQLISQKKP